MEVLKGELKRSIRNVEDKMTKEKKMISGRQIAKLIYARFEITDSDTGIAEITELLNVVLQGDNVKQFQNV